MIPKRISVACMSLFVMAVSCAPGQQVATQTAKEQGMSSEDASLCSEVKTGYPPGDKSFDDQPSISRELAIQRALIEGKGRGAAEPTSDIQAHLVDHAQLQPKPEGPSRISPNRKIWVVAVRAALPMPTRPGKAATQGVGYRVRIDAPTCTFIGIDIYGSEEAFQEGASF